MFQETKYSIFFPLQKTKIITNVVPFVFNSQWHTETKAIVTDMHFGIQRCTVWGSSKMSLNSKTHGSHAVQARPRLSGETPPLVLLHPGCLWNDRHQHFSWNYQRLPWNHMLTHKDGKVIMTLLMNISLNNVAADQGPDTSRTKMHTQDNQS